MNANLTINGLSFVQAYNDKDAGSIRRETSRGVNLPEVLTIKNQSYVDSATKIPGRRTLIRVDRSVDDGAGGIISGLEAHVVVSVPAKAQVETADVLACVTRLITLLAGTTVTGGLDLAEEIVINQEQ